MIFFSLETFLPLPPHAYVKLTHTCRRIFVQLSKTSGNSDILHLAGTPSGHLCPPPRLDTVVSWLLDSTGGVLHISREGPTLETAVGVYFLLPEILVHWSSLAACFETPLKAVRQRPAIGNSHIHKPTGILGGKSPETPLGRFFCPGFEAFARWTVRALVLPELGFPDYQPSPDINGSDLDTISEGFRWASIFFYFFFGAR
ncbi:hypothetical protein FN846DRAFT_14320 [Sphaerosporella brunnea]|uniref:Uncharacterized protein n=1 Tax=Sphaerosporella brunnea TaxID=1250544 RepID=A0A5J5EV29_9PEZI|nr:hypothetical protein FN846DRAFT_14320 [Sphaerosporella brunnea]